MVFAQAGNNNQGQVGGQQTPAVSEVAARVVFFLVVFFL